MKCPKCGYLGFAQVDSCRNCGYQFSLVPRATRELTLQDRAGEEGSPRDDLDFGKGDSSGSFQPTPGDLPLFSSPAADEPLITQASPPRTPLAVRRATAEGPRVRPEPRAQSFDLAFESEPESHSSLRNRIAASRASPRTDEAAAPSADAGLVRRGVAALIDLLILGGVDLAVIYFTLQICGLSFADFALLPKGPLVAFLLLQNAGYLVAFTVGGQTLGKMVVGIRVVAADAAQALDLARAVQRTIMWLVLVVPAGLGFLSAVLTHDHRGLHDRVAGTRVVRAPA